MKPSVRLARVDDVQDITPHLRRILLTGDEFDSFPAGQEGAHVKVLLPAPGATRPVLEVRGKNRPTMRSYTIADFNQETGQLALDFVVNLHRGPATQWALEARPGDFVGIAGPGPRKLNHFPAADYLLVGDLTSINAVKAFAQEAPAGSTGRAIIAVVSEDDIIPFETGNGIAVQWVIADDSDYLLTAVRQSTQPASDSIVFVAAEATQVVGIRHYLLQDLGLGRKNMQFSGYWKKGASDEDFRAQKAAQPI